MRLFCFLPLLVLAAFFLWPELDLFVSSVFYQPGEGFVFREALIPYILTTTAFYGARLLGLCLLLAASWSFLRNKSLFQINAKGWFFLFVMLLAGPGLVANVIFKDQWGRARPRETSAFGGTATFSPAFVISNQCQKNCSFVSGDASFGLSLPCLAYVVPPKRRRRYFWSSLAFGSAFGLGRLITGAHFFSDILSGGLFMLLIAAALHVAFYGKAKTKEAWRQFFTPAEKASL